VVSHLPARLRFAAMPVPAYRVPARRPCRARAGWV